MRVVLGKYLAASHKRKSHGAASGEEGRGQMFRQMGKSRGMRASC